MPTHLLHIEPKRTILLAVAAPAEAQAILRALAPASDNPGTWTPASITPRLELLLTGVGKANAAAATALALDPSRHGAVLSLGVAGALPAPDAPAIGSLVAASASVFADDGLATPDGFITQAELGFPPGDFGGMSLPSDPRLLSALSSLPCAVGPIATVSTCSGTDAHAAEIARRTGALAEAMEGAAVALVAHRLGVPFAELRAISNTTGARDAQRWNLRAALDALGVAAAAL